jgi:ABC-type nitrate/sulfonate/bicarbonate transport system ATPase subunit
MFQAESLMPWRTALDNVVAGLQFCGVANAHDQANEWLRRVPGEVDPVGHSKVIPPINQRPEK